MNRIALVTVLMVSSACSIRAEDILKREEADAKPKWKTFGSLRLRPESWSWFGTGTGGGSYSFFGSVLRVGTRLDAKEYGYLAELEQPALLGLPRATRPAPQGQLGLGAAYRASGGVNAAGLFVKQAYVRGGQFQNGHGYRVGRFEFNDGTELSPEDPTMAWIIRERVSSRLFGNFGWSGVGRSLDGVHAVYDLDNVRLTGIAAFPTRGAFDVHGTQTLSRVRTGYLSANLKQDKGADPRSARLFAAYYEDGRHAGNKVDNRPAPVRTADTGMIRIATLGGHYSRVIPLGGSKLDVLAWGAFQSGTWGAQSHQAYAYSIEAGIQPSGWKNVWLRGGYDLYSGDNSSADGQHKTFFPMINTPRIYARFPFFTLSNLQDAFVQAIVKCGKKLNFRVDAHRLSLADSRDLWYVGGGIFQDKTFGYVGRPSGGNRSLGTLLDLSADYALDAATSVTGYVGWAHGGGVVGASFPGRDAAFAYLEFNRRW